MTLYWWMHWFWITSELIWCILSADSRIVTSTNLSEIDTSTTNRPLRRNVKSVDQTSTHIQSQIPVLTTVLSKKPISSETTSDYSSLDSNSTITKCVYSVNLNNETISNLTLSQKNESQLLCNNKSIDNLNDTYISSKNLTDQDVSSSNITSYFLSTKSSLDMDNSAITSTGISGLSIMGIVFGVILFIVLICATSFILYRRSFANKPQTLNDKCSNLDSSGYIDDSSIRDNSEEMYSLDNDSFLNSLEAMTIQNYWTDNLKHTKL